MHEHERLPVDPHLLAALGKADLADLVARLLGLAHCKLRRHVRNGAPPSGELAEDVVQDAFQRVLSGERKFRPDVDLYAFFAGVVKSLVSHLVEKEENRCVHIPIEESAETLPDRKTATREAELAAAADVAVILHAFAGDERMEAYIHLRAAETCRTADEYARALGVTVADVRNMDRRLARYRVQQRRELAERRQPTDGSTN